MEKSRAQGKPLSPQKPHRYPTTDIIPVFSELASLCHGCRPRAAASPPLQEGVPTKSLLSWYPSCLKDSPAPPPLPPCGAVNDCDNFKRNEGGVVSYQRPVLEGGGVALFLYRFSVFLYQVHTSYRSYRSYRSSDTQPSTHTFPPHQPSLSPADLRSKKVLT